MNQDIMFFLEDTLQEALIDEIPVEDTARAGIITLGQLQDDPEAYRISVEIYENDPDSVFKGNVSGTKQEWADEVVEVEIGGNAATWARRFCVKARCLLTSTAESLPEARTVASTVKARIERALLRAEWSGIEDDSEYVSMPVIRESMKSEMLQSGGPEAYDFMIKVRFDIRTTFNL